MLVAHVVARDHPITALFVQAGRKAAPTGTHQAGH